jgi:hypothetical protein
MAVCVFAQQPMPAQVEYSYRRILPCTLKVAVVDTTYLLVKFLVWVVSVLPAANLQTMSLQYNVYASLLTGLTQCIEYNALTITVNITPIEFFFANILLFRVRRRAVQLYYYCFSPKS